MKSARLPTLSNKERLILNQLVADGPKYGLQMVDASRGALKRGTVYVTLGRMEQKGLIESRHETASRSGALPRRMYHATAHGLRVLDAWSAVARALAIEGAR
jgi:PadR family transcriptional regulator, regulatory protein PadR